MQENNESLQKSAREYGGQYDLQHRNAIIFSTILLCICIPGVSVSEEKIPWIKDDGHLFFNTIPWILGIAAFYSSLNFTIEWIFHAFPHWKNIKDELDNLKTSVENKNRPIHESCKKFNDSIDGNDLNIKTILQNVSAEINQIPVSIEGWHFDDSFAMHTHAWALEISESAAEVNKLDLARKIEANWENICIKEQELNKRWEKFALEQGKLKAKFEHYSIQIQKCNDILSKNNELAKNYALDISNILVNNKYFPKEIRRKLTINKLAVVTKVWIMGIFPPWALFFAAISFELFRILSK